MHSPVWRADAAHTSEDRKKLCGMRRIDRQIKRERECLRQYIFQEFSPNCVEKLTTRIRFRRYLVRQMLRCVTRVAHKWLVKISRRSHSICRYFNSNSNTFVNQSARWPVCICVLSCSGIAARFSTKIPIKRGARMRHYVFYIAIRRRHVGSSPSICLSLLFSAGETLASYSATPEKDDRHIGGELN